MQRKEFARVTPPEVGIDPTTIQEFLDELESGYTEMHGIMIMRHGKVCAEGWWAPFAPGLRHGLQSHTKTYAATAVGIAYTEGLLTLDDRIIDIFPDEAPENPSENLQKLKVRHVLAMGCGMAEMPPPTEDWIRAFLATPVVDEPGTTYMYNSTGSTLLGAIVRKLTGEGLHEYLTPRLFDKIGIDADNLRWICMPDGMEVGGGGLYATTEDNLRLMKLYADGGVWEGERILADDYVRLATTLQNESATEARGNPNAHDNFVGYGYQIWMCRPEGVYRADGAMGQYTIVAPHLDMLVSITETASGAHWAQKTLDVVWEFLARQTPDAVPWQDEAASAALKKRMDALCLPNPCFAPFSEALPQLDGGSFEVESGAFSLEDRFSGFMSGAPEPPAAKQLAFRFENGLCTLCLALEDGTKRQYEIALDGTRRLNAFAEAPVLTKLYLHGAWTAPGVFSLWARWVETCFETRYDITVAENGLQIAQQGAQSPFRPVPPEPVCAKRLPV